MPWMSRNNVDCRKEFVDKVEAGTSVAEAARACGVSRQTGYKWLKRFKEKGDEGLEDRSRAPSRIPHRTAPELVERCLMVRRRYPSWGPRKIRAFLLLENPSASWPASSTIGEWLDKAGLVQRRKWRRRTPPSTYPLSHAKEPNDVWSIDFKGQFRVGNGQYCYPLTVTDNATRFIIGITALENTRGFGVEAAMEPIFDRFGLPERIRSDNGSPFASRGPAGLSSLSVGWHIQGIFHERIRPGHPQENGRHERMHLTLKNETARPAAATIKAQQERFDAFITYFNEQRPHEAIGQKTPASSYKSSSRRPDPDPGIIYDTADDVRYVYSNGGMRIKDKTVHIGEAFAGCPVALREIDADVWTVRFADIPLGLLEKGDTKLARFDKH
jgi:transposase InsO family protein